MYVILVEKYVECLNSLSIQHVFMSYADEKYDILTKKVAIRHKNMSYWKNCQILKLDLLILIQYDEGRKKCVALGMGASHWYKKKKRQISISCKSYSTFAIFHLKILFSIRHKNMLYSKNNCHLYKKSCWVDINIVMVVKIV